MYTYFNETLYPSDVPPHTPSSGMRVPKDPADAIRDVFLANGGRLTERQTAAFLGRMSFTYGGKIYEAWQSLLDNSMWESDGDDYINPVQVALAERERMISG